MNKEKLKKIKVLYYPYKVAKKIITGIVYYIQYIISLFYISKNTKRVEKKIKNNEVLNVIFVVQYIPGWNKLEPIYSKVLKDQRFNPIIVCVPLNIQNHILLDDNGNDTYQYFIEHGYKAIDALLDDGKWFDLKQLNPDYLFHSRPYNHFMPKCYTSGKIVKYALICNVLYGLSLTHNVEPVLLNKSYFKDCYYYFSLNEGEEKYYRKRFSLGFKLGLQKCAPFGGIGIETILKAEAEKKDTNFIKTIIWTPRWSTDEKIGGSNFFNYRDTIVDLAKGHKDCFFIIRPHPLMFNNFIKTGEMSEQDVVGFKNWCKEMENVLLDETKEYFNTFWQSDILITDGSAIVPEYLATGKPILFCQSNNISETNTEFYNAIISRCYEVNSKEELLNFFSMLVSGVDTKERERLDFVNSNLKNYKNNSGNIVSALLGNSSCIL